MLYLLLLLLTYEFRFGVEVVQIASFMLASRALPRLFV